MIRGCCSQYLHRKLNNSQPFLTDSRVPCLLPGEPWGKCDILTNKVHLQGATSCKKALVQRNIPPVPWRPDRLNEALKIHYRCLHHRKIAYLKSNKNHPNLLYDVSRRSSLADHVLATPATPADCLLQCHTLVCQQLFPFVSDWETNR